MQGLSRAGDSATSDIYRPGTERAALRSKIAYRANVITHGQEAQRPRWAEWTQRRRWALAVLTMVAFLCAGLGIGVPAVLLLDYTNRQGDPPATPTEAADLYLLQLDQGEEIGGLLWQPPAEDSGEPDDGAAGVLARFN